MFSYPTSAGYYVDLHTCQGHHPTCTNPELKGCTSVEPQYWVTGELKGAVRGFYRRDRKTEGSSSGSMKKREDEKVNLLISC